MLLLLLSLSCIGNDAKSDGTDTATCDSAPQVTWDNWAHGFFLTYCLACHSENSVDRRGAPESVNFDTEAEVAGFSGVVRTVVLDQATMPIGGGVYEDDLYLLEVYLDCTL